MTESIDAVIERLSAIVAETSAHADPAGYFAALYRQVTLRVREGIVAGAFRDGDRMERLDVVFAGRYFSAYDCYRLGSPCSRSWQTALEATRDDRLTILQHLFLGMNAHINLDLGIAAATIAGTDAARLRPDFIALNGIIGNLVDGVQDVVAEFAPLLDVLDRVGGRGDERFADFDMRIARDEAWEVCLALGRRSDSQQQQYIDRLDRRTAVLGKLLRGPGGMLGHALRLVRSCERGTPAEIIAALDRVAESGPRSS